MCMRLLGTPASFKWLGDAIYIGHPLKRAITSRYYAIPFGVATGSQEGGGSPFQL